MKPLRKGFRLIQRKKMFPESKMTVRQQWKEEEANYHRWSRNQRPRIKECTDEMKKNIQR
jgi:hypothetical protein